MLTDSKFFQGSFNYLREIRAAGVSCPLLCKEFIVEAYQIVKARSCGADCVLLIAAVLPNKDLEALIKVPASFITSDKSQPDQRFCLHSTEGCQARDAFPLGSEQVVVLYLTAMEFPSSFFQCPNPEFHKACLDAQGNSLIP